MQLSFLPYGPADLPKKSTPKNKKNEQNQFYLACRDSYFLKQIVSSVF
jgi:hypothetical protein